MSLPRPASPKTLVSDVRAFFGERRPHQLIAAFLAVVIPAFIIFAFYMEARAQKPPEQVIYVHNWKPDRTDAEIKADQKQAQADKEAMAKERQRQFQELARQLGIK